MDIVARMEDEYVQALNTNSGIGSVKYRATGSALGGVKSRACRRNLGPPFFSPEMQ